MDYKYIKLYEDMDDDYDDIQEEEEEDFTNDDFGEHQYFYKFLDDHYGVEDYIETFFNNSKDKLIRFLNSKKKCNYIIYFMSLWYKSSQGYEYWMMLNKEWYKVCNKKNERLNIRFKDWVNETYNNLNFDNIDEEEYESIPEDFIGHDDFYNFLVDNNILNSWINNIKKNYKDNKSFNIKRFLDSQSHKDSNYILLPFDWDLTYEGDEFWDNIYHKWKDRKK
jgi:hypothetical protein